MRIHVRCARRFRASWRAESRLAQGSKSAGLTCRVQLVYMQRVLEALSEARATAVLLGTNDGHSGRKRVSWLGTAVSPLYGCEHVAGQDCAAGVSDGDGENALPLVRVAGVASQSAVKRRYAVLVLTCRFRSSHNPRSRASHAPLCGRPFIRAKVRGLACRARTETWRCHPIIA